MGPYLKPHHGFIKVKIVNFIIKSIYFYIIVKMSIGQTDSYNLSLSAN